MEQHRHVAFLRFEATVQLQIEAAGKILGRSVTFGPKSVENRFELDNFFELTNPNEHVFIILRRVFEKLQSKRIKVRVSASLSLNKAGRFSKYAVVAIVQVS